MASASDNFADRIDQINLNGWIAAGLALGTRLGLFKALYDLASSKESAVTTQQLADKLRMKERYVREWINGMVCGDIIDHSEVDGADLYWLEQYRYVGLIDSENARVNVDNASSPAQATELLMGSLQEYSEVERCFAKDGPRGTMVDNYPMLHDFQARRISAFQTLEHAKEFLCGDENVRRLEKGSSVLELGCGAAAPTKALAENFPKSTFLATDISVSNLEKAKLNCQGLTNVSYELLDACAVEDDKSEQFDLVMLFDVFHDVPYPDKLLNGAWKKLKAGGKFLMIDVDMPGSLKENKAKDADEAMLFYLCSLFYCMPTSLYYPDGAGLGACAGADKFEQLLREAGFSNISKTVNAFGLSLMCEKRSSH